jgi:hypothetical protein
MGRLNNNSYGILLPKLELLFGDDDGAGPGVSAGKPTETAKLYFTDDDIGCEGSSTRTEEQDEPKATAELRASVAATVRDLDELKETERVSEKELKELKKRKSERERDISTIQSELQEREQEVASMQKTRQSLVVSSFMRSSLILSA